MSAEEPFEPERVVEKLTGAGVRYVVAGGLASGAHGVIRATRALELVPDPEPANMAALGGVLRRLGARHPMELALLDGESLSRPVSMKLLTRHGEIHVLNRMPGTPPFEQLQAESFSVEVNPGIQAPICSLRHLRKMKSASTRERDAVDLAELDELHGPGVGGC